MMNLKMVSICVLLTSTLALALPNPTKLTDAVPFVPLDSNKWDLDSEQPSLEMSGLASATAADSAIVPEGALASQPSAPVPVKKMGMNPSRMPTSVPVSITHQAAKLPAKCQDPPSQETTLLYQIFLGFWGGAYGYIGRWYLFAAALAPGLLGCVLQCVARSTNKSEDHCDEKKLVDEQHRGSNTAGIVLQIIAAIFLCWNLGFWIWGMVQICNNDLKTGDDCMLNPDL